MLCGSVAKKIVGEVESSNDFDVIVPHSKWQTVSLLILSTARPNKFGGWRFEDGKGNEIDVWPGNPLDYLRDGI